MDDIQDRQNSFKRNVTGVVVSLVALTCIFFGGLPLYLMVLTVILIASKEYVHILQMKGFHPSFSVMAVVGVGICSLIAIGKVDLLTVMLVAGTIASFLIVLFMGRQPYIANVATTELGFMYGTLLPCHILLLRQIETNIQENAFFYELWSCPSEGFFLTMFTFLCVFVTDVSAYFIGKRHGKHKLSAVISPKKTIEGAIGGGILGILISMLGCLYTKLTPLECFIGGLLITIFSQLGDLSESLIKRDAGVKDSSNILPGHGGFLDRCDGFIFALPVAYYYFINFTHGHNVLSEYYIVVKNLINAVI